MQNKTTRAFRTISEAGEELDLQPHVLRFWESKFPQIKPMKRGGGRRFYRPEDIEFLRGIKILLHDEKHPIKDVQKLIRVKGAGRVLELGRSIERAAKPKPVQEVELIPERIVNFEPEAPNPEATKIADKEILRPISQPTAVKSPIIAKAKSSLGLHIAPVVHSVDLEDGNVTVPPPTKNAVEIDLPEVDYVDDDEAEYIETEVDIEDIREGDLVIDETVAVPAPPPIPTSVPAMDTTALENALERLTKLRGQWLDFKSS